MKLVDTSEIFSALSMIPFVHLSFIASSPFLKYAISMLWMSSMGYHMCLAFGNYTLAKPFYILDCMHQSISIYALLTASNCYIFTTPPWIHGSLKVVTAAIIVSIGYFGSLYGIKSKLCLYFTCLAHGLHAVYGSFFCCNSTKYIISMQYFIASAFVFLAIEVGLSNYLWTIGHIMLYYYTRFFWEALNT